MPIYDFSCTNEKCKQFNKDLELLLKVGEQPGCPVCQGKLQKVLRAPEGKRVPHISWSKWRV